MTFTKEQLLQNILIKVSTEQRKIINEAFDLYIDTFSENFGAINSLICRHYPEKMDIYNSSLCYRFCKILQKVYFKTITWNDQNKCQQLIKVHNFREDIKFTKRNFECTAGQGLFLSHTVLEFYHIILMGQLHHIDEQMRLYLYWDAIKDTYDKDLINLILTDMQYYYFGFALNQSFGICNNDLCPASKKAYQMARWIENDIHGYFKVKGAGHDYSNQPPLNVIKQKRIEIEFI